MMGRGILTVAPLMRRRVLAVAWRQAIPPMPVDARPAVPGPNRDRRSTRNQMPKRLTLAFAAFLLYAQPGSDSLLAQAARAVGDE